MTISEGLTLPTQPSSGKVDYVPLGGDGYSSPFAAYSIIDWSQTGDSGGGAMQFKIHADPRYSAVLSYMDIRIAQVSSADADVYWNFWGQKGHNVHLTTTLTATAAVVNANTIAGYIQPPALLYPGGAGGWNFYTFLKNVENDVYYLNCLIYLFDIESRHQIPIEYLLRARGPSGDR